MKMSSKFVIRLGVWCVLMLYLFLDLILLDGPLKQQVYRIQGTPQEKLGSDLQRGIVARVFNKPILLSQVDYGVDELLWRKGKSRADISATERKTLRTSVLHELCDHALLREKVALNDKEFPVSDAEIDAAMKRFASRFTTPDELVAMLKAFGFEGEKELRFRIAARLQQQRYIEHFIAPGIAVSDDEARAWYATHKQELANPERRNARHIFLARLGNSPDHAQQTLAKAQSMLASKSRDFASLAVEFSEDQSNKNSGGNLGWMTRSRLPKDFAKALFSAPLNTPIIVESKLGWHLLDVTDSKPSELLSFDSQKANIVAALESSKRDAAVAEYRRNLRIQHQEKIVIHQELLDRPWSH